MSESDTERGDQAWSQLRAAIGEFLMEFAAIESVAITEVIRALTNDPILVMHLEELLALEQKTKLIRKLLEYYSLHVPEPLTTELKKTLNQVKKLQEFRNEIAHNVSAVFIVGAATSVGVQRPWSKRPLPTKPMNNAENLENWVASCLHSHAQITDSAREAIDLRKRLVAIVTQLDALPRKPPGRMFKLESSS